MTKHTPGPWVAVWYGIYWDINSERDLTIGDSCPSDSIYRDYKKNPANISMEIAKANALLTAAAPDLLASLEWFVNDIKEKHTVMAEFDANVERAIAAIAKARGEE